MKVKKVLISIILIISLSLVLQINKVQAALQSNGDAPASKNRNTWMTQVRAMESLGGTLGLAETQNADLTSSSGSNNLDIHMQKNTEYGAMALLSASAYGNPVKIENGGTTTGNETGVVIPYNNEWTATQYTDRLGNTTYADRYINYYNTANSSTKKGDALLETRGWHTTTYYYVYGQDFNGWGRVRLGAGGLVRNLGNGIFGYNNSYGTYEGSSWTVGISYSVGGVGNHVAYLSNSYRSRAVIINGEGI